MGRASLRGVASWPGQAPAVLGCVVRPRPHLLDHFPQQPALQGAVGGVHDGGFEPRGPPQDGPLMAERVETGLAVVSAHAAVADASEGQVSRRKLHAVVVHADATRGRLGDDLLYKRAVALVDVDREGLFPLAK